MKLSEILGWPKKENIFIDDNIITHTVRMMYESYNATLTSCDREIDREALAKALYDKICHAMSWENVDYATHTMYIEFADHFISTMPTWLKPINNKENL